MLGFLELGINAIGAYSVNSQLNQANEKIPDAPEWDPSSKDVRYDPPSFTQLPSTPPPFRKRQSSTLVVFRKKDALKYAHTHPQQVLEVEASCRVPVGAARSVRHRGVSLRSLCLSHLSSLAFLVHNTNPHSPPFAHHSPTLSQPITCSSSLSVICTSGHHHPSAKPQNIPLPPPPSLHTRTPTPPPSGHAQLACRGSCRLHASFLSWVNGDGGVWDKGG